MQHLDITDVAFDEARAVWHVCSVPAPQVIQHRDLVASRYQRGRQVRAEKPRATGHQNAHLYLLSLSKPSPLRSLAPPRALTGTAAE